MPILAPHTGPDPSGSRPPPAVDHDGTEPGGCFKIDRASQPSSVRKINYWPMTAYCLDRECPGRLPPRSRHPQDGAVGRVLWRRRQGDRRPAVPLERCIPPLLPRVGRSDFVTRLQRRCESWGEICSVASPGHRRAAPVNHLCAAVQSSCRGAPKFFAPSSR